MTTNPNSGPKGAQENAAAAPRPERTQHPKPQGRKYGYRDQDDDDDGRHAAAEVGRPPQPRS